MAYSDEIKRLNFGLSKDDYGKVIALKKFLGVETDSELMRKALDELYFSVCQDKSFVEFFQNLLLDIDNLKEELIRLKVGVRCQC